jgi:hypothetical protein
MAFLTTANITPDLPTGFNPRLVGRVLRGLERELKILGLVFEVQFDETRTVKGEINTYNSLLDFNSVANIASVNLRYEGSSDIRVLTAGDHYSLVEHPNISGYFWRIEFLREKLGLGEYIEITGEWGIYIDFSDLEDLDDKSQQVYDLAVDWVLKQIRYNSANYQSIRSSSTGDTSVSFSEQENSKYHSSILRDPEFRKAINYFRPL